jgi:hypothetical protein
MCEEIGEQSQKIHLYDWPTFFDEFAIETIRPRGMIGWDHFNHIMKVLLTEIISKRV